MKKLKKLLSVLVAVSLLVLLPGVSSLTAEAAEPVTYSVKYVAGDINAWRFQIGSNFDDAGSHREMYYLLQDLKDGDAVVVYGNNVAAPLLDLGSVKLGNLTIHKGALVAAKAGSIKDCYVLDGSSCAVNGDVTNAYIYDNPACTFNNNVQEMTLYFSGSQPVLNLSCSGTVGHFTAFSTLYNRTDYNYYNISAGALNLKYGVPQMTAEQYSTVPTTGSQPAAPSTDSSDEYDSVPKTGDNYFAFLLLAAAAVCMTGSIMLKKKAQ